MIHFKEIFKKTDTSSFRIITIGFLLMILTGTLLLMLPLSSQSRTATGFLDALFTSVSATCVTGLVVRDTATYWSVFGQFVILVMIQIGGMGVITVGLAVMKLSGLKIGLRQRSMMQESISAPQMGGIVNLTTFILKVSFAIEALGAVLLMPVFCKAYGLAKGIWYSIFHSVSAFCNAGFDLMGIREKFSSLTFYHDNAYINVIIMLLIIIGGIGFMTWDDVFKNGLAVKKYRLQSKLIIITTAVLIFAPALFYFLCEYTDGSVKNRLLHSFFQSVTARTAGFNTTDPSKMSDPGVAVMTVLMLVGGSPGSTAGGMKTTTLAVLFCAAVAVYRRKNDVQCLGRRISDETVRNAGAVLFMYIILFLSVGMIIAVKDGLPLLSCLFESASAVGTVGLSLGLTGQLSAGSRLLLIMLMFLGRVGGLTLIYAAVPQQGSNARMPLEKVTVG